jgi:hypothetical protein
MFRGRFSGIAWYRLVLDRLQRRLDATEAERRRLADLYQAGST